MRSIAALGAAALVLLVALPIVALALSVSAADFGEAVTRGLWEALWLSLRSTTIAIGGLAVLGTPLAWWLGRERGRLGRLVEAVMRLPAVTPPAVAGVALLTAFGRQGVFGDTLSTLGVSLPFTPAAVVVAQVFVAAPFYVLPLASAFREIDEDLLWTARSLGATPARVFFRISLPLAMPALLGGLAIAWARALGEFGATLVFAGSLPGVTRTLPIAIYTTMEGDMAPARAMSLVLLGFALVMFLALRSSPIARAFGGRP
ncbi:MAG: molybdate ABC transporter permease subunit [Sandaracinaceae bacterium]|nr:molybdate ABC transporter permease subunit [Sandaracinaceae bacterium]